MRNDGDRHLLDMAVACDLSASEQRARNEELQQELFSGVQEVRDLPDGYALRFPSTDTWPDKLLAFVRFERDCCPFFTFALHFEPRHGPLWLYLRGPEGVKAFLAPLLPASR